MAIKLKKTLYVGLGGTGVSALLKIKKCFIDSYDEVPPMIGFLAIDTDRAASNKFVTGKKGERIILDPSELLVCTVSSALLVYRTFPGSYDWVPRFNVDKLSNIQGGGAGQVRSNGRFIAFFNEKGIRNSITSALDGVSRIIPADAPYEIDLDSNGNTKTIINVFASIAGGTGSGMIVDVLALIKDTLRTRGDLFSLYPWIIMPDVFKAMAKGPAMANVFYNTYGALRSLDYLMRRDLVQSTTPPVNLGHSRIDDPLFDFAYIINNTNRQGVTFDNLEDILDVVSTSAFLPANKMGDDLESPFDNIMAHRMASTYDILDKGAWAASIGSAELIYDVQAVGRVRAYTIISQLCESMAHSLSDGTADANKFFDDPNVMIRENNGRDDVINSLLSPAPEYTLDIDEKTTLFDITSYIENNCSQNRIEAALRVALNNKLSTTKSSFDNYIVEIMKRPEGKVDAAIKFIKALRDMVAICKAEMVEEEKKLNETNSYPEQWDVLVNAVPAKGLKSLFGKPINEEAVEILQSRLVETVSNKREEIRRSWAIKFYDSFDDILHEKLQSIEGLRAVLDEIGKKYTRQLLLEQSTASSSSKFQLFLHQNDVFAVSEYKIDSILKTNFLKFLPDGVSPWIGQSVDYIDKKLFTFASNSTYVKDVLSTSIDEVLRGMPEETIQSYLDRLKLLASPLWQYNAQGYNDRDVMLDRFVVLGVGNRDTSFLCTDERFKGYFDINDNHASFASSNQYDRISLLMVEDLLPIYAVNNFLEYERDTMDKIAKNYMMANYIDEKLYNRMNSENFKMIPTIVGDNVLSLWVNGFIFDYIHFDYDNNQYWIRSKKKGDPINKYRFNLGSQRDVAYELFKSEELYKEVEEGLDRQIASTGRQPIEEKIATIKAEDGSYLEKYAQLSTLERDQINEQKFMAVKILVSKEIELMSE